MTRTRNPHARGMLISFMVIAISAFNFINFEGTQNFKAIHVVTLLLCGMGIGVFLKSLISFIKDKNRSVAP